MAVYAEQRGQSRDDWREDKRTSRIRYISDSQWIKDVIKSAEYLQEVDLIVGGVDLSGDVL